MDSPFQVSVFPPLQATMTELQEVQITEEKPLLPGQTIEVAKVVRDPLTLRPELQTTKQPCCLAFPKSTISSYPTALISSPLHTDLSLPLPSTARALVLYLH